jgi:hypothetical protein
VRTMKYRESPKRKKSTAQKQITGYFRDGDIAEEEELDVSLQDKESNEQVARASFSKEGLLAITTLAIFGLVNTGLLISTNVNSSFFEVYGAVVEHLPDGSSNDKDNEVTMIGPRRWGINYYWIPTYVFDKNLMFSDKTTNIEIFQTEKFVTIDEGEKLSKKYGDSYLGSVLIGDVENLARNYDFKEYPYTNMKYNQVPSVVIRANY